MEVVICKTKEEASRLAADMISALVKKNPKCVLGLATGSTPVPMYKALTDDVHGMRSAVVHLEYLENREVVTCDVWYHLLGSAGQR